MKAIVLILGLTLAGCATDVPRTIREAPAADIPLAEALKNPDQHRGAAVRWGGAITKVENRRDETWIEVVERPLDRDGQPRDTDQSAGRFLARAQGFLDPAIFAPKRLVTVAGTLDGNSLRSIGEHPYTYPVVRAEHVHLWPVPSKTERPDFYPPYRWYDPWYPWGYPYPYPYHRLR